jgi:diguanylate cyclase (GGDEF)-like protein
MTISLYLSLLVIFFRLFNTVINTESSTDFLSFQLDSIFIAIFGITNVLFIPGLLSIFRSLEEQKLKDLSRIDALTGLMNRRSIIDNGNQLFLQSKREKKWISLYMIDIDDFKKFNDKFGHTYGDNILVDVAKVLKSIARRPLDIISRYGGEEFVIILYDCNFDGGMIKANEIIRGVSNLPYDLEKEESHSLSVSVGFVSFISNQEDNIDNIVQIADELMYQAKSKKTTHVEGIIKNE